MIFHNIRYPLWLNHLLLRTTLSRDLSIPSPSVLHSLAHPSAHPSLKPSVSAEQGRLCTPAPPAYHQTNPLNIEKCLPKKILFHILGRTPNTQPMPRSVRTRGTAVSLLIRCEIRYFGILRSLNCKQYFRIMFSFLWKGH